MDFQFAISNQAAPQTFLTQSVLPNIFAELR
jgi:hypothetical protein